MSCSLICVHFKVLSVLLWPVFLAVMMHTGMHLCVIFSHYKKNLSSMLPSLQLQFRLLYSICYKCHVQSCTTFHGVVHLYIKRNSDIVQRMLEKSLFLETGRQNLINTVELRWFELVGTVDASSTYPCVRAIPSLTIFRLVHVYFMSSRTPRFFHPKLQSARDTCH